MTALLDTSYLIDDAFGHVKSECLFASVELGVFNQLAKEEQNAEALANRINISTNHSEKLLNCLAFMGLLEKVSTSNDKAVFKNSPVAKKYLVKDSQESGAVYLGDWVKMVKDNRQPAGFLADIVRSGGDVQFKSSKSFDLGGRPEFQAAAKLTKSFDLSAYKTFVNVNGGNSGKFCREMLSLYPQMQVKAFDLPSECSTASVLPENKGIQFISGDAMSDDLPSADLYSIVHSWRFWDDATATKVLKNIVKSMGKGSGLLIMDSFYNEGMKGPSKYQKAQLGRLSSKRKNRRTVEDFKRLLTNVGLEFVQVQTSEEFGLYDAIFAKKN